MVEWNKLAISDDASIGARTITAPNGRAGGRILLDQRLEVNWNLAAKSTKNTKNL